MCHALSYLSVGLGIYIGISSDVCSSIMSSYCALDIHVGYLCVFSVLAQASGRNNISCVLLLWKLLYYC